MGRERHIEGYVSQRATGLGGYGQNSMRKIGPMPSISPGNEIFLQRSRDFRDRQLRSRYRKPTGLHHGQER